MSFRHLWAVARKEVQHVFRDTTTLISVLLSPTIMLLLMAYSMTVDLKNIPIAVLNQDRSQTSMRFVQQIFAGDDLVLYADVGSMDEIETLLLQGKIKAAVVIHPDFSKDIMTFRGIPIQIIIDGTEPASGGFALDHIGQRVEKFIEESVAQYLVAADLSPEALQPIDLRVRTWYNPSLKPRVDMIPGLISMVLAFPALSVALALAHEHEHGTMEQLMATPIGRGELLLGKMVPYILVGLLNVIILPILAMMWFHIPFNGSFVLYILISVVFMFSILGLGIMMGVFMKTQAVALALSLLVIFFPGFFLTGIFFPIVSLPDIVAMEAMFLPGTHYAIITRGVFLTGVGFDVLWPFTLMMAGLGVGFVGISALFFRKKLG